MKRATLVVALFLAANSFGQVTENKVSKQNQTTTENNVQKESYPNAKVGKINKPVIDKFTKPKEVNKPIEEKAPINN